MRILILGAGGIGGYFGGRLAQAQADVTFLVREQRAKLLRDKGLVIASPLGDARVAPKVVTHDKLDGPYDLIVVSSKAYDLGAAIDSIRPAVGDQTTILPLLNGLAHLDRLDEAFGADKVIGGSAYISVTLGDDGTIRHLNKLDGITYGPREAAQDPRCDAIDPAFAGGGFTAKRSAKMMQDMWEKFVFITAAASITCLMRADIRAIMAADDGERLTKQMLDECQSVAAAAGFPVPDGARAWANNFLTDRKSDFKASMLRDLESGLRVEAEQLPGDMIRRGQAHGVKTELLRVAYANVQAYQHGRDEARSS